MKTFSLLLLMYWSVVREVVLSQLCEMEDDFHIKAGLYIEKQLILFTSDERVFHIKNFEFKTSITKDSVEESNMLREWAHKIRFIFRYKDSVYVLNYETESQVSRLVAYKLDVKLTESSATVLNYTKVRVNPYTYVPNEDPINLMSLLAKFPEDEIENNILSIVSFPFDEPKVTERFFVYYLERPLREGDNGDKFKRHIMIWSESQFGDSKEVNWKHDNKSGKCVPEDTLSNTVVRVSDKYVRAGDLLMFDIMEFIGDQFVIKGIQITNDVVQKEAPILKKGSIKELLGCEVSAEPTDIPPIRGKSDSGLTWVHIIIAILILCFIIGIIILIVFIVKVVNRIRYIQNRRNRRISAKQKGKLSSSGKMGQTSSSGPSKVK